MSPTYKTNKKRVKKIIGITTTLVVSLVLIANIILSQTIPELYFRFINEERDVVVSYLTSIKPLPIFHQELIRFKNKYGGGVEKKVFSVEEARKKQITKMEEALQKNSQSRDLLYGLAALYGNEGNSTRAEEYLKQAKEIDPTLK